MEQWRLFHSDMKELTTWLDTAEKSLAEAKTADDFQTADKLYLVSVAQHNDTDNN